MAPRSRFWLKLERLRSGVSQRVVYSALGVSRPQVDKLEKGRAKLAQDKIEVVRRIMLLPHFSWEEEGKKQEWDSYERRTRYAASQAVTLGILEEMEKVVRAAFSEAVRQGKAHLLLVCFEEFQARLREVVLTETSMGRKSRKVRKLTQRDFLTTKFFDGLKGELGAAETKVEWIQQILERASHGVPLGQQGKPITQRERANLEKKLRRLEESRRELTIRLQTGRVTDRELRRLYPRFKGLIDACSVKECDLDAEFQGRIKPEPLEDYWRQVFSGLMDRNYPDSEWDEIEPGFKPSLNAKQHRSGKISVTLPAVGSASPKHLRYVHANIPPLELENFGDVPARKNEYVCVVSFKDTESHRYFQLLASDDGQEWRKSCVYAVNRDGLLLPEDRFRGCSSEREVGKLFEGFGTRHLH